MDLTFFQKLIDALEGFGDVKPSELFGGRPRLKDLIKRRYRFTALDPNSLTQLARHKTKARIR